MNAVFETLTLLVLMSPIVIVMGVALYALVVAVKDILDRWWQ